MNSLRTCCLQVVGSTKLKRGKEKMASQSLGAANKESRHLWVGGLPDTIDESGIKEYFSR